MIDGIVDTFNHAGEDESRLDHILVGINANNKMRGAAILLSLLLNRIKRAQARPLTMSSTFLLYTSDAADTMQVRTNPGLTIF